MLECIAEILAALTALVSALQLLCLMEEYVESFTLPTEGWNFCYA